VQVVCDFFLSFVLIYNDSKYILLIINELEFKKVLNFFLGYRDGVKCSLHIWKSARACRGNPGNYKIIIVIFLSF